MFDDSYEIVTMSKKLFHFFKHIVRLEFEEYNAIDIRDVARAVR